MTLKSKSRKSPGLFDTESVLHDNLQAMRLGTWPDRFGTLATDLEHHMGCGVPVLFEHRNPAKLNLGNCHE